MTRKLALLVLTTAFAFTGCDRVKALLSGKRSEPPPIVAQSTPAPPTPPGPESPRKPAIDTKAQVVVLCYHRLEGKVGGALSIEPTLFEKHMEEIKQGGLSVISMQDFLAWRRYEKSIPPKSVIITIDDGYASGYEVGWPILKRYNFPFTMFVYLDYIARGGKSLSWDQLGEMRDAGVDIGSHTVSHQDLRRKGKGAADYDAWLHDEVFRSKQVLEERLGIKVATIAYPYGHHNEKVHAAVKAAGYEAAFSVYGQRLGINASALTLGRYDVTAKDAQGRDAFSVAVSFQGMAAPGGEPVMAQDAAASMVTAPLNGETITDPQPVIKANLSTMGALDDGTVAMRVSGLGLVPAQFEPATKMISYSVPEKLKPGGYTVIISAKSAGRPVETRWTFQFNPSGAAAPQDATAIPEAPVESPPSPKVETKKKKK